MRRSLCFAALVALLALGWSFRYDYTPGPLGLPLRMNRFTGQVEVLKADPEQHLPLNWYLVPMGQASQELQEAQARQEEMKREQEQARRDFERGTWSSNDPRPSYYTPLPLPRPGPTYPPATPERPYFRLPPATIRPPIREFHPPADPDIEGLSRAHRQY